jgi:phage terminase Nu1 subunit (DNA packaging protein)
MKLVNSTELGALLGVHRGTISDWLKAGLPIHKKARPGEKGGHQFIMKDVVTWLESRAVNQAVGNTDLMTADEAKRRKLSAEAGLQEIILAKRKGDVIELSDVEKKLSNSFAILRSSMLKIPDRTSMQLVGETDEEVIKQVLKQEITEALEGLANWDSFDTEEEEDE